MERSSDPSAGSLKLGLMVQPMTRPRPTCVVVKGQGDWITIEDFMSMADKIKQMQDAANLKPSIDEIKAAALTGLKEALEFDTMTHVTIDNFSSVIGYDEQTSGLRFIVRTVYPGGDMGHPERQRILQQAWQNRQTGEIDWRDVPTEIEE